MCQVVFFVMGVQQCMKQAKSFPPETYNLVEKKNETNKDILYITPF